MNRPLNPGAPYRTPARSRPETVPIEVERPRWSLLGAVVGAVVMALASALALFIVFYALRVVVRAGYLATDTILFLIVERGLPLIAGALAGGIVIGRIAEHLAVTQAVSSALLIFLVTLGTPWWAGLSASATVALVLCHAVAVGGAALGARRAAALGP